MKRAFIYIFLIIVMTIGIGFGLYRIVLNFGLEDDFSSSEFNEKYINKEFIGLNSNNQVICKLTNTSHKTIDLSAFNGGKNKDIRWKISSSPYFLKPKQHVYVISYPIENGLTIDDSLYIDTFVELPDYENEKLEVTSFRNVDNIIAEFKNTKTYPIMYDFLVYLYKDGKICDVVSPFGVLHTISPHSSWCTIVDIKDKIFDEYKIVVDTAIKSDSPKYNVSTILDNDIDVTYTKGNNFIELHNNTSNLICLDEIQLCFYNNDNSLIYVGNTSDNSEFVLPGGLGFAIIDNEIIDFLSKDYTYKSNFLYYETENNSKIEEIMKSINTKFEIVDGSIKVYIKSSFDIYKPNLYFLITNNDNKILSNGVVNNIFSKVYITPSRKIEDTFYYKYDLVDGNLEEKDIKLYINYLFPTSNSNANISSEIGRISSNLSGDVLYKVQDAILSTPSSSSFFTKINNDIELIYGKVWHCIDGTFVILKPNDGIQEINNIIGTDDVYVPFKIDRILVNNDGIVNNRTGDNISDLRILCIGTTDDNIQTFEIIKCDTIKDSESVNITNLLKNIKQLEKIYVIY